MVNHCANPDCHKSLHYLRDGKVFLFSSKNSADCESKLPHKLEHFWLCGACAKRWTLAMDGDRHVTLLETRRRKPRVQFPPVPVAHAS